MLTKSLGIVCVVLLGTALSCVTPESTVCGDIVCPGNLVCREGLACVFPGCGDNLVGTLEDCDGDNLGGRTCLDLGFHEEVGLGCAIDCTYDVQECSEYCGDGIVADAETCDTRWGQADVCLARGFDVGRTECTGSCEESLGGCSLMGWKPQDSATENDLEGIWAASRSDIFAVGGTGNDTGTIVHFDGESWSRMQTPTVRLMLAVSGTSAESVIAVGFESLLHYDGQEWTQKFSQEFPCGNCEPTDYLGVWATDATSGSLEAFAVGFANDFDNFDPTDRRVGRISRYENDSWAPVDFGTSKQLSAVWGRASDDVYVVGDECLILHFDGTAFTPMEVPAQCEALLLGVWGTEGGDTQEVFAVGTGGAILHSTGGAFEIVESGTQIDFFDVSGSSANDIYVVGRSTAVGSPGLQGLHYNGSRWAAIYDESIERLNSVWAEIPQQVLAVGDRGVLLSYEGSGFWSGPTRRPPECESAGISTTTSS